MVSRKSSSFDILILVVLPAAQQGSSTLAKQVLAVNSIAAITNMTFANTLAWQIAANATTDHKKDEACGGASEHGEEAGDFKKKRTFLLAFIYKGQSFHCEYV